MKNNNEELPWTDKYLSPNIERDKLSFKKIKSIIVDFVILFFHALSFHKLAQEPLNKLPDISSSESDLSYDICRKLYDDANERIDGLEGKSIKLLSYISAIFALISFVYNNIPSAISKNLLVIAMLLLVVSIVISFRCVNVKGRKAFFLPDLYDFDESPPKEIINKDQISSNLRDYAIFNQSVADNTADLVRASRYSLTIAILLSIIALLISMNPFQPKIPKITKVVIEKNEQLSTTNKEMMSINNKLETIIENDFKSNILHNSTILDSLQNEMVLMEANYELINNKILDYENTNRKLLSRIDTLEHQMKLNKKNGKR